VAYADLRDCSEPLRFAMKAARRAPRAQGITVSFFAAAATTPLMKRVLVFMILFLDLFFWRLPLLEDEYDPAIGPVFGSSKKILETRNKFRGHL